MNTQDKNYLINMGLLLLFSIVIVFVHQNMDMISFNVAISWYFYLLIFTLVGFPLSYLLFRKFYDRGYVFAKVLGFLVPSYLMWCGASLHIFKFTYLNALLCVIAFGIISYLYLIITKMKKKNIDSFVSDISSKVKVFYRLEIIFLILFLLVAYVKGFNPDANSTEKYMDYGFMAVMSNTDYFPSMDMWLAGESINYYYFGHYILTFIAKVTRIDVSFGYNLSIVTLFVITLFESYIIGFNLVKKSTGNNCLSYFGGIISSLGVNIAGNFHYVIFNLIYPMIYTIFHLPYNGYSFWDSTRYIGYNPDTVDKVIHEFPNFSYILGDLHSHVIDIFLVLLLLGLLLSYLFNEVKNDERIKASTIGIVSLNGIMLGLIIGMMKMTNFWDYPIYLVVIILFFFFHYLAKYQTIKDALLMLLYQVLLIICLSQLFTLPFTMSFVKIASKIAISPYHTIFYQLLVLWGIPSLAVLYYFIYTIKKNWPIKIDKFLIRNYVEKLKLSDFFILIIGFCAIGLVITPEFLYVVDIFYDSIPRFNTVFKFTYQSFILFGLCYGYIIVMLFKSKKMINQHLAKILIAVFLLTCCYCYTAVEQWFGDITNPENYKTLDATAFLERETLNYDDALTADNLAIINYLNEEADKNAIIIEAKGDSYSSDNQISTFTGLATVLGWSGHEWLWRSKNSNFDYPEILTNREDDITVFYSVDDVETLINLIDRYSISYIVIGYTERKKYGDEFLKLKNEDALLSLGDVVVETNINGSLEPTYLIKVNLAH